MTELPLTRLNHPPARDTHVTGLEQVHHVTEKVDDDFGEEGELSN